MICLLFLLSSIVLTSSETGLQLPTKCEVCRLLVHELLTRLNETRSSDTIKVATQGNTVRKIKYDRSELRLTEVLHDPPLCQRMLNYKLHKERKGCSRFDKTIPETQRSLNELAKRGVDLKLDVPLELWDKPSVEITSLYKECITMVSTFEEDIEEWFYNLQDTEDLLNYICRDRALKDLPQDCLLEEFKPHSEKEDADTSHKEL